MQVLGSIYSSRTTKPWVFRQKLPSAITLYESVAADLLGPSGLKNSAWY